jgi:hypothetical protein
MRQLVLASVLLAALAAFAAPASRASEGAAPATSEDTASRASEGAAPRRSEGAAHGQAPRIAVRIDESARGERVPMDFLGLSYEVRSLPQVASLARTGDLVSLLRSLGRGVLRFGGASADTQVAWLDPASAPRPSWARAALVPQDLYDLAALARATGWRVLLTVNLGHFDPQAAADEAHVASVALGRSLEGIEIGNEPTAFVLDHLQSQPYLFSAYQQEVSAYISAIRAAAPGVTIAGPDSASGTSILPWTRAEAVNIQPALLTSHFYGTSCSSLPKVPFLLSRKIQGRERRDLLALASVGRRYGIPVRLDETNNVSCGGVAGVSDTYGAALWAVGLLTRILHAPFVGVNFHGFLSVPTGYSPLAALTPEELASGAISARPEWYALLLAHEVEGDRPLPVRVAAQGRNLAVWAGRTPSGDVQTIIDNEQPRGSRPLRFDLPRRPGMSAGSILRLAAPSLGATSGVTLGGRAVSADGSWRPAPSLPHARLSGESVSVVVDPQSAALVSIEHSGRPPER